MTDLFSLKFEHFDRPQPTLAKSNQEFWNFYLTFFQIFEFQMWSFGQKFGRSVTNILESNILTKIILRLMWSTPIGKFLYSDS